MLLTSSFCSGETHSYASVGDMSDTNISGCEEESVTDPSYEEQARLLDPSSPSFAPEEKERPAAEGHTNPSELSFHAPSRGLTYVQQVLEGGSTGNYDEIESEYDDETSDDEVDASNCRRCKDEQWNRHAWGLLLTKSEKPGNLIRVGAFTSRARWTGGTKYFATNEFIKCRDYISRDMYT